MLLHRTMLTCRCSSFALLAYCFDSAVSVFDICVIPVGNPNQTQLPAQEFWSEVAAGTSYAEPQQLS